MGTRQWGVRAWLVGCLALVAACPVSAEEPAADPPRAPPPANTPPCPSSATPDERLRCEMKHGSSAAWPAHLPASLHEEYLRLLRQAKHSDDGTLDLGPIRYPLHPWAGKQLMHITPTMLSLLQAAKNQQANQEDEEQQEGKDWAQPKPGKPSTSEDTMPKLNSQVRVRRPHVQTSYRQELRRPRFRPWGGKRSGKTIEGIVGRGRLGDVMGAEDVGGGALTGGMDWLAAAANPRHGGDARFIIDTKRKAFSPWAGKRSEEDAREAGEEDDKRGFSAWAGKRSEDNGKRGFSAWAGKRSEGDEGKQDDGDNWPGKLSTEEKRKFSAWAGKRSDEERQGDGDDGLAQVLRLKLYPEAIKNDDEKKGFSAWAGKRSEEGRPRFSAWAGKRSNEDCESYWASVGWLSKEWIKNKCDDKKRSFSAWAGKRNNEETSGLNTLAGTYRYKDWVPTEGLSNEWTRNMGEDEKRGFSAWAGKRSIEESQGDWGAKLGQTSSIKSYPEIAVREGDDQKRSFSAWAGKRSDYEKRKFSAWAGKRSEEERWGGWGEWPGIIYWALKRNNNDDEERHSSASAGEPGQLSVWRDERR